MEVSHCNSLQQLNIQLNRFIDPRSGEWPSVTARNIEDFISNNRNLIIDNQAALVESLNQLASKVERELEDEHAVKLARRIRSLTIHIPQNLLAKICEAGVEGTQLEKGIWLGSISRASRLFDNEAVRLRIQLINSEKLPISIDFGLESKEDFIKFMKRYGHALTYLNLDAVKEKDIFKDLTTNELNEILSYCPNLKELSLNGFSGAINNSIWDQINSLSHLTHLSITVCEGIKFIPTLTLENLECLKFHGTLYQIPETFPGSLLELDLMQPPGPVEFNFISSLPPHLKVLKLTGFSAERPPVLPGTLREISLTQFYCVPFPAQWPANLEKLNLSCASFEGPIPPTPDTLIEFVIDWCQGITQIPVFSDKLKKLSVDNCQRISEIRVLPPNVEEFYFVNESSLITIPTLTLKLKSLGLSPCVQGWQALIDSLPKSVTRLDLSDPNMKDFSLMVPAHVESLSLVMLQLEKISSDFPDKLREFFLITSIQFQILEKRFPDTLQKLTLACGIAKLPSLPKNLIKLEMTGCMAINSLELIDMPHLREVGCWNRSLKKVTVRNCPKLNLSSILSNPLTHLTLIDLPQIRSLTGLNPQSIVERNIVNCKNLKAGEFLNSPPIKKIIETKNQ